MMYQKSSSEKCLVFFSSCSEKCPSLCVPLLSTKPPTQQGLALITKLFLSIELSYSEVLEIHI